LIIETFIYKQTWILIQYHKFNNFKPLFLLIKTQSFSSFVIFEGEGVFLAYLYLHNANQVFCCYV